MDGELEKIDVIRSRFRIGYDDARAALAEASGDVIAALAALEKRDHSQADLVTLGAEMADEVQRIASGGPIKRLKVKYGNRILTETPVALTAATALAVGLAAVLISKLVIELEKEGEEAASE